MIYAALSPAEQRRLVDAYAIGLSAGSGGPWMLDDSPETIAFAADVTDAYYRGLETWQACRPPWPAAMPERLRAAFERDALADARPPDFARQK